MQPVVIRLIQNKKISGKLKKLNEAVAANNGATAHHRSRLAGREKKF
jgi:hypothetical protein